MAGNDDMANNGNIERSYTDAVTAQLGERVTNLGRRQSDLETEMRAGFKQVENGMSAIANEMRTSISALSSNLSERNKPQWQAIGVAITFCTVIGGLAYWPINSSTSRLENAVLALSEKIVTRQEMEYRQARGAEDRNRMEISIKDVREAQVPRAELERVWTSQANTDSDQQRQIDELKQAQTSVYGARDVILDLRQRVDRMEREKASPGS
jgi:hypothetical protein